MNALRILVLEDDAVVGMLLGEMLTVMGYDVCAIEGTEADAVSSALACAPDLMIVEAWLDDGSGVSAVAQILQTRFIPHIFVAGDPSRVLALLPDAVVIQKPFREADLLAGIVRALGLKSAAQGGVGSRV